MISDRKKEERTLRKKRIIQGALKVFNEHGIEKTTMDEIAHESGFGKATLYYYFSSKDEVFVEIMEHGWKRLWEGIETKIIEELGPRDKFMGIVKKMGRIVTGDKILYGFLFTAPNYIQGSQKQSWKTYSENQQKEQKQKKNRKRNWKTKLENVVGKPKKKKQKKGGGTKKRKKN